MVLARLPARLQLVTQPPAGCLFAKCLRIHRTRTGARRRPVCRRHRRLLRLEGRRRMLGTRLLDTPAAHRSLRSPSEMAAGGGSVVHAGVFVAFLRIILLLIGRAPYPIVM